MKKSRIKQATQHDRITANCDHQWEVCTGPEGDSRVGQFICMACGSLFPLWRMSKNAVSGGNESRVESVTSPPKSSVCVTEIAEEAWEVIKDDEADIYCIAFGKHPARWSDVLDKITADQIVREHNAALTRACADKDKEIAQLRETICCLERERREDVDSEIVLRDEEIAQLRQAMEAAIHDPRGYCEVLRQALKQQVPSHEDVTP